MKYDAPAELPSGGGNWIDKPGTYHLIVTATDEEPVSRKKEMLDAFKVDFQALGGTVQDSDGKFTEKDKTIDILFWHPKLTQKNEGLFARQKQAAFFIATGLLTESQLGQAGLEITLDNAVGRHVIATFEAETGDDGKQRIQLAYADIFHIDDPRAAAFPKNESAIALIPSGHRRDPKTFTVSADASKPANADAGKPNPANLDDL